ncbi:MAG: glycosyltransferase family 4 protein [Deltaproteobacteria bacterium]|nr:glycosyltransferase family 4 protein [Deltaproteobacteria bacterium]
MIAAILTSSYLPVQGGIQYELYWLLKEFDHRFRDYGIKKLVFIAPAHSTQEYLDFKNIDIIKYNNPLNSKYDYLSFSRQLSRLQKVHSIDIIHCHSAYPEGLCCLGLKLLNRTPYLVTCHGEDIAVLKEFNYGNRLGLFKSFLTNIILKQAQHVTTISRDMAKFAFDAGCRKNRLTIIPNGIDLNKRHNSKDIQLEIINLKEKYQIADSDTVYLTLSGMRKIKGHENLIRAFALSVNENNSIKLFIGAHGAELDNLKALTADLNLNEHVFFIDFVYGLEKAAWFSIADVYCNTAFFEPFGIVYLEAIQQGIAVLGSSYGGAKDIFTHDHNACLIDPYDTNNISTGITKLASTTYRNKLSHNSAKVLPQYDIGLIADEYLSLLKQQKKNENFYPL